MPHMAETITIPSPSLFLSSADPNPTAQPPVKKAARRLQQPAHKHAPQASNSNGVTKRKQSKSRNGCLTCKAKRLKCDETKPTCQQCARRSVTCGGYKKDFKWRPFEEASFTGKPPAKTKKASPTPSSAPAIPNDGPVRPDNPHHPILTVVPPNAYYAPPPASAPAMHGIPQTTSFVSHAYPPMSNMFAMSQPSPYMFAPPPISPVETFTSGSGDSSISIAESENIDMRRVKTTAPSSVSSGQSPRLVDLLLPGTNLDVPPEEYMSFRSQHESIYQPTGLTPPAEPMGDDDDDDVEEIPRSFNPDYEPWAMRIPSRLPSPTPSTSSSSSSNSRDFPLFSQPSFSSTSPEILTRRFDRDTCGILSVKDGPTENPWRTLVWPLARDCPALYHAIASMTSFHQSKDSPAMRIQGIDHMRTSVHALASSLEDMRVDAAISTTLVLAFSESWDQHISTGINHIKGAKILIDRALVRHTQTPVRGEEFNRLKFLCNTWIYMDVIARLTSTDDDESNVFDVVYESMHMDGPDTKLDPLMGCASTLFPIIGRVANLVRRVRRTNSNSPTIISQAMELKSQLEEWTPPSFIEDPEDETTSPHDSIKTATAYQYATLLYLHQAVPEIPSLPSAVLAKRVLCEIATVEPRSRSTIVHIYPLMAAGCEVTEQEDRDWVQTRWDTMSTRMKLGIIERCLEVTKEVWNRRDAYAIESEFIKPERNDSIVSSTPSLKREFGSISDDFEADGEFCWIDTGSKRRALSGASLFDAPIAMPVKFEEKRRLDFGTEPLERDFTVKGRLHWLGVMKDWNWEVLLG